MNFTSILVWPAIYISKTVIHSKKSQCDLLFSSSSSAQSCWLLILVKCRTFSGLIDVYQWHQLLIRTQEDILNGTRKRGLNKWLKTLFISISANHLMNWAGPSFISLRIIIIIIYFNKSKTYACSHRRRTQHIVVMGFALAMILIWP